MNALHGCTFVLTSCWGGQDSDDEDEQVAVAAQAQVLMNCAADMVRQHGVKGFADMHDLHILTKGSGLDRAWNITGQLPKELGGGMHATHPAHAPGFAPFPATAAYLPADFLYVRGRVQPMSMVSCTRSQVGVPVH